MGKITLHETLALRWAELRNDASLQDLAAKLELNGMGVIELSPASNRHGMKEAAISNALSQRMPEGTAFVQCSLATTDGVRVPDVAWAAANFIATHGELTPFPSAPENGVEVRSPSDTDAEMAHKTRLYLEGGAVEVWIVTEQGAWRVFDAHGEQPGSRFAVTL